MPVLAGAACACSSQLQAGRGGGGIGGPMADACFAAAVPGAAHPGPSSPPEPASVCFKLAVAEAVAADVFFVRQFPQEVPQLPCPACLRCGRLHPRWAAAVPAGGTRRCHLPCLSASLLWTSSSALPSPQDASVAATSLSALQALKILKQGS